MTNIDNIAIIGNGNLGHGLARAFELQRFRVSLIGRNNTEQLNAVSRSDLIFITTQDASIEAVCEHIAPALQAGSIVAHCSASLGTDVLSAAQQANCNVASTHPLNTFPNIQASIELLTRPDHNSYCYITTGNSTADKSTANTLSMLFERIGFTTGYLEEDAKTAYHAACVFACNYLTSIAEMSLQSAEMAGLDRDHFWAAIQPLLQATLNNISEHGTAQALSGPIARGDVATVEKHLDTLKESNSDLQHFYALLGQHALTLAKKRDNFNENTLEELINTLKST